MEPKEKPDRSDEAADPEEKSRDTVEDGDPDLDSSEAWEEFGIAELVEATGDIFEEDSEQADEDSTGLSMEISGWRGIHA